MRRYITVSIVAAFGIALCGGLSASQAAPEAAAAPAANAVVGSVQNPANLAHASAITVDGDGAEWTQLASLPLPFMKKDASDLKLAWNEKGLYGFATVKSTKIPAASDTPWGGDCVELWIEKDCHRAADSDDTDNATQYAFAPNPDNASGEGTCVVAWGSDNPGSLKAAWKKTADGFTLEFFIPAASLTPAKMAAGTKLGLNFAIDVDGKAIQQFYHDKDIDSGYRSPNTWGVVTLGE